MDNLKKILLTAAIVAISDNVIAWSWISPYAYCMGTPISFIDQTGEMYILPITMHLLCYLILFLLRIENLLC